MPVLIPWFQNNTFPPDVKKKHLYNNKNTLAFELKAFILRFAGDSYQDFLQFNFVGFPSFSATSLVLMSHLVLASVM